MYIDGVHILIHGYAIYSYQVEKDHDGHGTVKHWYADSVRKMLDIRAMSQQDATHLFRTTTASIDVAMPASVAKKLTLYLKLVPQEGYVEKRYWIGADAPLQFVRKLIENTTYYEEAVRAYLQVDYNMTVPLPYVNRVLVEIIGANRAIASPPTRRSRYTVSAVIESQERAWSDWLDQLATATGMQSFTGRVAVQPQDAKMIPLVNTPDTTSFQFRIYSLASEANFGDGSGDGEARRYSGALLATGYANRWKADLSDAMIEQMGVTRMPHWSYFFPFNPFRLQTQFTSKEFELHESKLGAGAFGTVMKASWKADNGKRSGHRKFKHRIMLCEQIREAHDLISHMRNRMGATGYLIACIQRNKLELIMKTRRGNVEYGFNLTSILAKVHDLLLSRDSDVMTEITKVLDGTCEYLRLFGRAVATSLGIDGFKTARWWHQKYAAYLLDGVEQDETMSVDEFVGWASCHLAIKTYNPLDKKSNHQAEAILADVMRPSVRYRTPMVSTDVSQYIYQKYNTDAINGHFANIRLVYGTDGAVEVEGYGDSMIRFTFVDQLGVADGTEETLSIDASHIISIYGNMWQERSKIECAIMPLMNNSVAGARQRTFELSRYNTSFEVRRTTEAVSFYDYLTAYRDVALATLYMNAVGICHKDVKPGNMLVNGLGRGYLADFGLSTPYGTVGKGVYGTRAYTPAFLADFRGKYIHYNQLFDAYALAYSLSEKGDNTIYTGARACYVGCEFKHGRYASYDYMPADYDKETSLAHWQGVNTDATTVLPAGESVNVVNNWPLTLDLVRGIRLNLQQVLRDVLSIENIGLDFDYNRPYFDWPDWNPTKEEYEARMALGKYSLLSIVAVLSQSIAAIEQAFEKAKEASRNPSGGGSKVAERIAERFGVSQASPSSAPQSSLADSSAAPLARVSGSYANVLPSYEQQEVESPSTDEWNDPEYY